MAAGPDILAGGFLGWALPPGTSGRAVSVGVQAQLAGRRLTGDVQERSVVAEVEFVRDRHDLGMLLLADAHVHCGDRARPSYTCQDATSRTSRRPVSDAGSMLMRLFEFPHPPLRCWPDMLTWMPHVGNGGGYTDGESGGRR